MLQRFHLLIRQLRKHLQLNMYMVAGSTLLMKLHLQQSVNREAMEMASVRYPHQKTKFHYLSQQKMQFIPEMLWKLPM